MKGWLQMKIRIMDKRTGRAWDEEFSSPYIAEKRMNKIKYSKNLTIICIWRDSE